MDRLEVLDSLKGQRYVAALLGPIFDEGVNAPEGSIGNIMGRLQESLECLPDLLQLFVPYCTHTHDGKPDVSLKPFYKLAFKGRPVQCLAFIAHCIQVEYGDFLSERGRAPLVAAVESLSIFQPGSSGTSGE